MIITVGTIETGNIRALGKRLSGILRLTIQFDPGIWCERQAEAKTIQQPGIIGNFMVVGAGSKVPVVCPLFEAYTLLDVEDELAIPEAKKV
jgi:hypothetical protein